MENNNDISSVEFDRIEKYLLHQMEAGEENTFVQQINSDPLLAAKVAETRLLILGASEEALAAKLHDIHANLQLQAGTLTKPFLWIKFFLAAAVLVVVSVSAWLLLFNKSANQQLFTEYYSRDAGLLTAMGVSDNYAFDKAMIDYKSGKYEQALRAWQKLEQANTTNDTLQYFIGSSYLAMGKAKNSVTHFESVVSQPNSYFLHDAYWYLALAYVKLGQTNKAIAALQQTNHEGKAALLKHLAESK